MRFHEFRRGRKFHTLCDTLRLYLGATLKVEALVIVIVIAPLLFVLLCAIINSLYYPLGALLFWAVFIPLAGLGALVDYARKHREGG